MLPAIETAGAVVEPSYLGVFWRACVTGPETIERNHQRQVERAAGPSGTIRGSGTG